MKAYIAAHIFTPDAIGCVNSIKEMLENRLHLEVFSPYHASRDVWKGRAPKDCTEAERRQVLEQNITNLDDSDILVSWINRDDDGYDGRPDTGVVWEMGYYECLRRWGVGSTNDPAVTGEQISIAYVHPHTKIHRKGINLMLTATVDAVVTDLYMLERACRVAMLGSHDTREVMRKEFDPQSARLQEGAKIA